LIACNRRVTVEDQLETTSIPRFTAQPTEYVGRTVPIASRTVSNGVFRTANCCSLAFDYRDAVRANEFRDVCHRH